MCLNNNYFRNFYIRTVWFNRYDHEKRWRIEQHNDIYYLFTLNNAGNDTI